MSPINIIMETYMQVLQKVLKKSTIKPTCEYYNGCKTNQQLFMRPICEYCNGCKTNQQLFTKLICGYYIFEMALWKL